ncbi:MAG: SMP-30/gluconolactonase/LRE family protein [Cytophagales bacterium]|nr:SMP-30/gluconolactonase/LRE family protein [Cytophagales bacterium]
MLYEPHCIWPLATELGEGPVWSARDQALYFVDIKGQTIHRWSDHAPLASWHLPEPVGFVQPMLAGGWVAGLKSGLYRFDEPDWTRGPLKKLLAPEPALSTNRLNDAFTDADGHLWFGSMDDAETHPLGQLYCVEKGGQAIAKDAGYVITNGPCTSPDGRIFYHTDTLQKTIYAFDVLANQQLSNKRALINISRGYPDGTAVDAAGCLWVALFAGGALERYSPRGELLQTVALPCPNVTKLAFGGADLRTAYVTTARKGMTAAQRAAQPLAGGLFSFEVDTPGLPQNLIRHGFA